MSWDCGRSLRTSESQGSLEDLNIFLYRLLLKQMSDSADYCLGVIRNALEERQVLASERSRMESVGLIDLNGNGTWDEQWNSVIDAVADAKDPMLISNQIQHDRVTRNQPCNKKLNPCIDSLGKKGVYSADDFYTRCLVAPDGGVFFDRKTYIGEEGRSAFLQHYVRDGAKPVDQRVPFARCTKDHPTDGAKCVSWWRSYDGCQSSS